jgi:nucleoid DNA-binding protein
VLARDLVREAAARMGCYQTDAKRLLDIYCRLVSEALAAGKDVHLHGLGVFKPLPHRRRQTVRFVAAKRLRQAAARAPKSMQGPAALADELAVAAARAGTEESAPMP